MLKIETGIGYHDSVFWTWLFIKNWMFCTVNAIIFDIKDYPSDANRHLRTFVVRYGLRRTIFNVLIPLLVIGLLSLGVFAYFKGFGFPQVFCNVLPFVLTIYVAYSMHKRKNILYYLMVIDGLILFKAICGIIGMQFVK
jgi:4-hydroxybenzoate polyprenyltransferase